MDKKQEIGQPRLQRSYRSRTVELSRRLTEVQYQVTMLLPDKTECHDYKFRQDLENWIAERLGNIHVESIKLEIAGKIAGFTRSKCVGKRI